MAVKDWMSPGAVKEKESRERAQDTDMLHLIGEHGELNVLEIEDELGWDPIVVAACLARLTEDGRLQKQTDSGRSYWRLG
jgi:predicted transcriptional regulator